MIEVAAAIILHELCAPVVVPFYVPFSPTAQVSPFELLAWPSKLVLVLNGCSTHRVPVPILYVSCQACSCSVAAQKKALLSAYPLCMWGSNGPPGLIA